MVRKMMRLRASKYLFFAALAIPFNMLTFHLARDNMPALAANLLAYYVGAQFNFLGQDRGTFVDHFETLAGGWSRWRRFMFGQSIGGCINFGCALGLIAVGTPIWSINGLAMMASGVFNYTWTHYVSHNPNLRGSKGKPAPVGVES